MIVMPPTPSSAIAQPSPKFSSSRNFRHVMYSKIEYTASLHTVLNSQTQVHTHTHTQAAQQALVSTRSELEAIIAEGGRSEEAAAATAAAAAAAEDAAAELADARAEVARLQGLESELGESLEKVYAQIGEAKQVRRP